jgi:hypothetical protein
MVVERPALCSPLTIAGAEILRRGAARSLFGQIPKHNLWLFFSFSNATREATVKSGFVISFAALALLISIPTGAGAVGVGKQCGGFVIHPQECNRGLFCQRKAGQCFIADISGTCARIPRFCPRIFRPVCGCDGRPTPMIASACARRFPRTTTANACSEALLLTCLF